MMNIFKAVYCNQYFELKPKGKALMARMNGTQLLTVSLALNLISITMSLMLFSEGFTDEFGGFVTDTFGRNSGSFAGKVLALIPFLIMYPLVKYTLGREAVYYKFIGSFAIKSPEEQALISKRGFYFILISVAVFILLFIVSMIFLT